MSGRWPGDSRSLTTCRGQGRIERERTLEVPVPAGVDSGTRLRMAGQGEPGTHGGAAGDLYIFLEVKEHEFFERRGSDLICEIPISVTQAALGTKINVPTLRIPKNSKSPKARSPAKFSARKPKASRIRTAAKATSTSASAS